MRLLIRREHPISKKGPLGPIVRSVFEAFVAAGLPEPAVGFVFADSPLGGPAVERALRRFPGLQPAFRAAEPPSPAALTNFATDGSLNPDCAVPTAMLFEVLDGMPRSLPFHGVSLQLRAPAFGEAPWALHSPHGAFGPGVLITDQWWVNGRMRGLQSYVVIDADPGSKKLPPLSAPVEVVLAALGKPKKIVQIPMEMPPGPAAPDLNRIREVVDRHKAGPPRLLEGLPHDLPPLQEVLASPARHVDRGPMKPALQAAFGPMGYDCKFESGTFRLQRRTPNNLTVELSFDVGTWSHLFMGSMTVHGVGFRARLPLAAGARTGLGAQYPIGGPEGWQKIVDNLAALVRAIDASMMAELDALVGPQPEWYTPQR